MASTYEVRLGSQGRLVIPAELRERLGAKEGVTYVATVDETGALVLRTRAQALQALRRSWAATGEGSPTDELIAERRRAAEQE